MPVFAEDPVQDPVRIGPSGLVLDLSAGGEHAAHARTGRETSGDEVAPENRRRKRSEAREGRVCPLEENGRFRELAAYRGRGGASELVGGGDPHEQVQIGARRLEAAPKSPISLRSRFVLDVPGGREVFSHEGCDPVDQPTWRPQPAEEIPRRLDPRPVVTGSAKSLGDRRLSEVVTKEREHERLVVFVATPELSSAVKGEQGMAPHVALGMPARVLGHADERLDFRKEPDESRLVQKLEADGGSLPEQEELAKLSEHPLRRQLREVELTGKGQQFAVGIELEAGCELRRPKAPQGVFREVRGIGYAEPSRGEVRPPPVRVENLAGERIEAHRIDAEVPAAGGGGEVEIRRDLDREAPMSRTRLVVAARQREIRIETVDADDPERPSDLPGSSERGEDRLESIQGESEDFHVHVGRRPAEETVAHLPPDEEGASARVPCRPRDVGEARVDVAEVGAGFEPGGLSRRVRRHCCNCLRGASPPAPLALLRERPARATRTGPSPPWPRHFFPGGSAGFDPDPVVVERGAAHRGDRIGSGQGVDADPVLERPVRPDALHVS